MMAVAGALGGAGELTCFRPDRVLFRSSSSAAVEAPPCWVAVYPGREVHITVADKGIGIPDIPRAMEPLFTTGNPEERSGLGFAVMQSFMDKVKVTSKPGKGTRVLLIKRLTSRQSAT